MKFHRRFSPLEVKGHCLRWTSAVWDQDERRRGEELQVWGLRAWELPDAVLQDGARDAALRAWVLPDGARDEAPVCPDAVRDAELRVSVLPDGALPVLALQDGARDEALRVWVLPDAAPVSPDVERGDDPDRGAELLPLREAAEKPSCRR